MANEIVLRLARLPDSKVIELFKELSAAYEVDTAKFFGLSQMVLSLGEVGTVEWPLNSHMLVRAVVPLKPIGTTVEFRRGIAKDNINDREPSAYFDEIQISVAVNSASATFNELIRVTSIVESYGLIVQQDSTSSTNDSATDIISAEVAKLSELASQLTVGADETRRRLDLERSELRAAFDTHRAELDITNDATIAKLEAERAELLKLREELDDREHKHVRRQLRETITSDLNDEILEPKSSKGGALYSYSAVGISLCGLIGFSFLAFYTQNAIINLPLDTIRDASSGDIQSSQLSNSPQVYLLYLKLFATSGAAFGLLLYTIAWLRRLSSDATRHQQQLQRHVFDMNRASWTIETILELSASELPDIPEVWLTSVTNNLFLQSDAKNEEATSLQALAALLNVTSEAEIGPDGPKFKLNRKGAKRAAAEGE